FTCAVNPTVTMYECGTSATCASPTTIGTVTITVAGQAFAGTVSAATITAGDYIGWAVSAGTCTSLDLSATAQIHTNKRIKMARYLVANGPMQTTAAFAAV